MREIPAAKFKEQCLALLEDIDPDGMVIAKRRKPIAELIPVGADSASLVGSLRGKLKIKGNRMSTGSSSMLNPVTYVLLDVIAGGLSAAETRLLHSDRWSISAIVLWEIAKQAQLGRIEVDLDDAEVVRTLARVQLWPITREIARTSTQLDGFPCDPSPELNAFRLLVP